MKVKVEKVIFEQCTRVANLCEEDVSEMKIHMFTDSSDNKIVAGYNNRTIYAGKEDPNEQNNCLLIRNKRTNKVRLVSYDTVNLELFCEIKGASKPKIKKDSENTRADLAKHFGSKLFKRVVEQQEKLKFDIDNAKETLESAVQDANTGDAILNISQSQVNDGAMDYFPVINRNASTVEEVYCLENVFPSTVMEGLESDFNTVLQCDDLSQLPLHPFCLLQIKLLRANKEIENDSTRCKVYLYLNYLVEFLVTPVKNMTKKFVICHSSSAVNYYILDNFSGTSKNVRTRSPLMKDKLISHILVLALLASSNKKIDLEALSLDMKLGIKKLQEISRMLAFSSDGPKKVCLKLPLPAPISLHKRKKKI